MAHRLLVLGWHNVESTWAFPAPPGRGERGLVRQLQVLSRWTNVVDLGSALEDLAAGRPLPPRAVALTFDDGYRDNLTLAAPVLRAFGMPATFFLVPAFLSRASEPPWWEIIAGACRSTSERQLVWNGTTLSFASNARESSYDALCSRLKQLDETERRAAVHEVVARLAPRGVGDVWHWFLDWDDARVLADTGVTVGMHGLEHAILANEPSARQRASIVQAREQLERELGREIRLMAYPNGTDSDFDAVTEAAAADAGLRAAVTTIEGWNTPATPPFRVRRFVMYPEHGVEGFRPIMTYEPRRVRAMLSRR